MKVHHLIRGKSKVIQISGRPGVEGLKREFRKRDSSSEILLDFSGVTYLEEPLIRFLKGLAREGLDGEKKIKLLNPSGLVKKMFEFHQLTRLFPVESVYPTAW